MLASSRSPTFDAAAAAACAHRANCAYKSKPLLNELWLQSTKSRLYHALRACLCLSPFPIHGQTSMAVPPCILLPCPAGLQCTPTEPASAPHEASCAASCPVLVGQLHIVSYSCCQGLKQACPGAPQHPTPSTPQHGHPNTRVCTPTPLSTCCCRGLAGLHVQAHIIHHKQALGTASAQLACMCKRMLRTTSRPPASSAGQQVAAAGDADTAVVSAKALSMVATASR